jgi:antitoxin YefM
MKILSLSEVKTRFSEIVDVVEQQDETVTVTRKGKPVAVIVSKDEYDGLQETIAILSDPQFMKEIRAGIQALKKTKKRYTVDELFAE